jgi:hypothetical protein
VGALADRRQLPEADLVEDLAGILVAEVVADRALPGGQGGQRGGGEVGPVGQDLVAGDEAVAAEQRHEPRQAGRRQADVLHGDVRVETQRREVCEAARVHVAQRVVAGLERGGLGDPGAELVQPLLPQLVERARPPPHRVRAVVLVGARGDDEGDPPLLAGRQPEVEA